MTTLEFLSHLRSRDIKLWVDGEKLRYSAASGALTPAVRHELAERKAEILELLRGTRGNTLPILPVSRDRDLPLSFAQQRLWILNQLEPDSPFYNMPQAIRMSGALSVKALRQALGSIVSRHESLRTTFASVDGSPRQVIAPTLNVPLPIIDLSELPEDEREAEARRLATEEMQLPFNLARGPLVRFTLLRLSEGEHVLLLMMHHIVSDGWSMGVLVRELTTLYEAFSAGRPSPLPELPVQYADYAVWQREWLTGEVLERQLSYWKKQLAGVPAVLELPTDRTRPAVQSFRGARRSVVLLKGLTERLKALSQREGVTLFMTLLAAFQTLLHRYTQQDDIVVGSPIANRNWAETEGLIGFFVNTLALRTDLSGDPMFRELLGRVREVTLGAYEHQDLPFEKLVEELQPERSLGRNPLFQVMFALQNAPRQALELSGLTLRHMAIDITTSKFDMSLVLIETTEDLRGVVEYNTDLFDASTITRLLRHYQVLLAGIVANPDQRLSRLPLLSDGERHQLLVGWNQTWADHPQDKCVHELFEAQVARTPEAVAVAFEEELFAMQAGQTPEAVAVVFEEQLTYQELNCRANQLAHYLRRRGVGPGVRAGLLVERSIEMIIGLLGVLKAGGAYVPLDPAYPQERLRMMLADAEVAVVVAQERLTGSLPGYGGEVVCIDAEWEAIVKEGEENPESEASAESLAYVIYTSGSTGRPKGVAVPHRAVNRLVMNTDYVRLEPFDVVAQVSNTSFDAATFEIWGALLHGARLVIITKNVILSPQDFAVQIDQQGVSVMFLTTALFNQLAREVPSAFRKMRYLLFGGEAVEPRWVAEVLKTGPPERLLHVYGPTETTTFASWYMVESVAEGTTTIPIGRPIANTQIYLLDRHLNPVPVGIPGELYIGGDGLARGYFKDPALTAERFIPHPFSEEPGARLYKTGDLARYLPDGNIEFLGRKDHQVKIRGFRIELGEIEALLSQHPRVRQTVVVAREDQPGEKRLVAYLVAPEGQGPSVSELGSYLQQKLPHYMLPSAFVLLDSLPLTPNGKVDYRALPAPDTARPEMGRGFVAPRDPLGCQLTQIWEELLGVHPIGVKDNFFDLGGHSLLAVRLMDRIEKALGQRLPLATLFAGATIEHLASVLIQEKGEDFRSPLVEIQSHGSKRPFFFLHGDFTGGGFYCLNLARGLGPDQPFYALQPHGLDGSRVPLTVEAMAADQLKTLCAFQPEGPYLLGGYCNGGLVAYEMARQLVTQGHKVDLLALIHIQAVSTRFRKIAQRFDFLFLPKEKRASSQVVPARPDLAARTEERLREVEEIYLRYIKVIADYVPGAYPGRVTLLWGSEGERHEKKTNDPTRGWGEVAAEVKVYPTPGGHLTCITKHVEALAECLRSSLREAQAEEPLFKGTTVDKEVCAIGHPLNFDNPF